MLDTRDVLGAFSGSPERLVEVARRAAGIGWSPTRRREQHEIGSVVVLGVGLDASAGDALAVVGAPDLAVPVVVVRGALLPRFVGPRSLVLALSTDGRPCAPETLDAAEQAIERGAIFGAVAVPGALAELAERAGVALHRVESGEGSRASLGLIVAPLLVMCEQLGLLSGAVPALGEATAQLAKRRDALMRADGGIARALARRIGRTFPVLVGAEGVGEVAARRFADQIVLSAKTQAFAGAEPDRSAVGIAGFGQSGDVTRQLITVVELRTSFESAPTSTRVALSEEYTSEAVAAIETIHAEGGDRLSQLLDLALVGDFVALHLAASEGLDPGPTPVADELAIRLVAR